MGLAGWQRKGNWTVEWCENHHEWEVRNPKDDYLASFHLKRDAVSYAERIVPNLGVLAIGKRSRKRQGGR